MAIPKVLNFIWVGTKAIPDEAVNNIKDWIRENPNIEIRLWIDTMGTISNIIKDYHDSPRFFADEIRNNQLKIMDITEHGVSCPEVRYEIDRLRPNYGAASDLLRYNILKKFGGAYLDCDNQPILGRPLEASPIWDQPDDTFLRVSSPAFLFITNDAFFCSANNAFAAGLSTFVIQDSYKKSLYADSEKEPASLLTAELEANTTTAMAFMQAYLAENISYIFKSTLEKTGPDAVEAFAEKSNMKSEVISEQNFRMPISPGLTWMRRGVRKYPISEMPQAINAVIKEISFEISHAGVLRLDDHIRNLVDSMGIDDADIPALATALIREVKAQINLDNVCIAQLTFKYPEVAEFIYDNHLQSKTFLFPYGNINQPEAYIKDIINVLDHAYQPYNNPETNDELPGHIYSEMQIDDESVKIRLDARWNFLANVCNFYYQEMEKIHHNKQLTTLQAQNIEQCLTVLHHHLLHDRFNDQPHIKAYRMQVQELKDFTSSWLESKKASQCCGFWHKIKRKEFPAARTQFLLKQEQHQEDNDYVTSLLPNQPR